MNYHLARFVFVILLVTWVQARAEIRDISIPGLKNFQVNNARMVSAALPNKTHFESLKSMGVTKVIDLIPGDRSEESILLEKLQLDYHNIPVVWGNPTLDNFREYVSTMKRFESSEGIILTHCQLNWRGAVFTYLYRVTQLGEPRERAAQDLRSIWQPDKTWQGFIDKVLAHYQS